MDASFRVAHTEEAILIVATNNLPKSFINSAASYRPASWFSAVYFVNTAYERDPSLRLRRAWIR